MILPGETVVLVQIDGSPAWHLGGIYATEAYAKKAAEQTPLARRVLIATVVEDREQGG